MSNSPRAPLAPTATAFTSTSTSAVQIHSTGTGKYVVRMTTDQNCYIKFGDSTVGAASSSSWPLVANKTYRFKISTNDSGYFRVIRNSADGTLSWAVEGKVS